MVCLSKTIKVAYLNLDLFKGLSHEKYYFLDFVAADGCIYDKSLIIGMMGAIK